MKIFAGTMSFQDTQLSKAQGNNEKRSKMYKEVLRASIAVVDAVICQQHGRVSGSARKQAMR